MQKTVKGFTIFAIGVVSQSGEVLNDRLYNLGLILFFSVFEIAKRREWRFFKPSDWLLVIKKKTLKIWKFVEF